MVVCFNVRTEAATSGVTGKYEDGQESSAGREPSEEEVGCRMPPDDARESRSAGVEECFDDGLEKKEGLARPGLQKGNTLAAAVEEQRASQSR